MSVACATFRARTIPPSGRRRSSCAKATSSTCRSTTATTGRATPTRRCPVRACRSTRRATDPRPATAARAPALRRRRCAFVPYDPATGDYIGPDGKQLHPGRPGAPGQQDLAVDAGAAGRTVDLPAPRLAMVAPWQSAIRAKWSSKQRRRRFSTSSPTSSRRRTWSPQYQRAEILDTYDNGRPKQGQDEGEGRGADRRAGRRVHLGRQQR